MEEVVCDYFAQASRCCVVSDNGWQILKIMHILVTSHMMIRPAAV